MKFESDREYLQALDEQITERAQGDLAKRVNLQRDFALERCISRFNP